MAAARQPISLFHRFSSGHFRAFSVEAQNRITLSPKRIIPPSIRSACSTIANVHKTFAIALKTVFHSFSLQHILILLFTEK
jgi:hypothetical protein